MAASSAFRNRKSWLASPWTWAVLWVVVYFTARETVEGSSMEAWKRVALALTPIPLAAVTLVLIVRGARRLDELERRIQIEALATAFVLSILFLMTLGLLQRAVTLKFEDWSYAHVWAMLPMLYALGLAAARRRYQ